MDNDFFQISGWLFAVISVIVNVLQLVQNSSLKKRLAKSKQSVGDNSTANQQTHSGTGHNINSGGNANVT